MIENIFADNQPVQALLAPENYTRFARSATEPVYLQPPYTSILDETVEKAEIDIERARYRFERGFPARIRAGQDPLAPENAWGTRLSPLRAPEQILGSLMAVSI